MSVRSASSVSISKYLTYLIILSCQTVADMDNEKLLFEFQNLCQSKSPSTKEELVSKGCTNLQKHFKEASADFVKSEELEVILNRHIATVGADKGVKSIFQSIWDLNEVLKVRKKAATKPSQNGTAASDSKSDVRDPSNVSNGEVEPCSAQSSAEKDKSQRRIDKLEKKLGKLHRAIQKLSEKELTLDEMEDEQSIHIQEYKLRQRFVKGWDMLCKLKKISNSTGRTKEKQLTYRSSSYKEINAKITKLMNQSEYFPDYQDVLTVVERANEKYNLGIDEVEVGVLAREIFVDVGTELKRRRQQDLIQSFGYADFQLADSDPAEVNEELRSKLEANGQACSKKLTEEINKYTQVQGAMEARGEDLEAASEDEEEDQEEDPEVDQKGDGGWEEEGNEEIEKYLSDEEQLPAKRRKTENVCEDGLHCGTDSESSEQCLQDSSLMTRKVSRSVDTGTVEWETSDIDSFIREDETKSLLTSEEESSMTEGGDEEHGEEEEEEQSDLSIQSIVSLSDDEDGDDEVDDDNADTAADGSITDLAHSKKLPPHPEVGVSGLNGFHQKSEETPSANGMEVLQAAFTYSVKESNNSSPPPCASDWEKQTTDSDPIDSLGVEGLVPVPECHSYTLLQSSQSSKSLSASTTQTVSKKVPNSTSSDDYIEILSSSPSPSTASGEKESEVKSQSDSDVVIISDSD